MPTRRHKPWQRTRQQIRIVMVNTRIGNINGKIIIIIITMEDIGMLYAIGNHLHINIYKNVLLLPKQKTICRRNKVAPNNPMNAIYYTCLRQKKNKRKVALKKTKSSYFRGFKC